MTIFLFAFALSLTISSKVYAADSDFSNGITVDSTLNAVDANIGDTICDDGSGNCTLRAAIEEANSSADVSTIKFSIPGSGVKTLVNTAVAPNPMNGTLLIEVDGSSAGTGVNVFYFGTGSDGSIIKGLVIGDFSQSIAINIAAPGVQVQGNYIGTNPTATSAKPNEIGLSNAGTGGTGALIGGLNPADRNIISGNTDGPAANAAYPTTDWVIQGNYVGVGADGVSAIPNNGVGGAGAFSVDNCSNVLIGGGQPGAANVISGNNSYGIAPDNSPGLHISGNYIGTDYTGTQALPNLLGILMSGDQEDTIIGGATIAERNVVSGNIISGILAAVGSGPTRIEGNYVGLNKSGTAAIPNGTGVFIAGHVVVGGSVADRNVISGNSLFNVTIQGTQVPAAGGEVSGNYIGTNAQGNIDPAITALQGEGVRISANASENLIGGEAGNVIAGNRGAGISVRTWIITQLGITANPTKNAILGNQIYANEAGGPLNGSFGLGIDLYRATVDTIGGLPADIQADSYIDLGVNANDAGDNDAGPNDYINFPVLYSAVHSGDQLLINFDLDSAGSPEDQYRVEFFSNDQADPSGYGEGQNFLGSATVSNGSNQQTEIALPADLSISGKSISATATAVDSNASFGYGATSEFSKTILGAEQNQAKTGSNLADTGTNRVVILVASLIMIMGTTVVIVRQAFAKFRFN